MADSPTVPQILLTAQEAAQALGISRALLYALISEGKIRRVKLHRGRSGAVRFRPSDLEEFAEAHVR